MTVTSTYLFYKFDGSATDPQQIATQVLVPTMGGAQIPLGQLAKVVVAKGAPGIRTENALLSAYIYVDIRDRDIGGYVRDAKAAVAVGFIALAGVAAETGVIMLIYLDHAHPHRPLRRCDGRCVGARAPEDDDRGGDHGRPASHHVGNRNRLRSDEPHSSARR